jgi:branched-chain amino acid transport system ATP-binding protein
MSEMTGSDAPRLAAHGITVRFGGLTALDNVDVNVWPGKVTGLIGPNGAGKSTLFAVLSGLQRPARGRVLLSGRDVTRANAEMRARLGLARTFQHPELFNDLTVGDHFRLARRARFSRRRVWTDMITGRGIRESDPDEEKFVIELLALVGLPGQGDRPVQGLPLGISRLVELGRALAAAPNVLLLDEPTSGLDGVETELMAVTLERVVAEQGVGLLIVEHDVDLVLSISARVTVLDFGARIAEGTPDAIRRDPAVRAAYLGGKILEDNA